MSLNRSGKTEMGTIIAWIAIVAVIAYVANFNGFQDTVGGFFGGTSDGGGDEDSVVLLDAQCPSDGTTTYTLNVQDGLTSTATDVTAQYFVFNGNKLIKEGTVAGSGTFDVACGKDYTLLLLNTTTSDGAYSKTVDLKARISDDTINEKLIRFGTANILGIENPADPARDNNVTLIAGATKFFDIKFTADQTDRGYNHPIILCQVNITSIQSVSIGSFSDGTPVQSVTNLPKRITANAGYQYYAWEYPKMLTPSMGVVVASGSITAGSTTPSTADSMDCIMADQATWQTASYKTSTGVDEGFKTGAENTETLAEVGGADASVSVYEYIHAGGY